MYALALEDKEAESVIEVVVDASKPNGPYLGKTPAKYQTDNGPEFINDLFINFCKKARAEFAHSLPYSPWVQGQVLIKSFGGILWLPFQS